MLRLICFFSLSVCLWLTNSNAAMAQRHWTNPARPMQGTARFLGLGYSHGYQWRNPGPNTDYYNPYTPRNSELVTSGSGRITINSNDFYGGSFLNNGIYSEPEDAPKQIERPKPESDPLNDLKKLQDELKKAPKSSSILNRF